MFTLVDAIGANWVVGIHVRLVMGVTDSDWDESQHVVGKLTASILRALLDR